MQVLSKKTGAWIAVAALGATGLFAQTPPPERHHHNGAKFAQELNLTDAQKAQMKSIFHEARQQAAPFRDQLRQTRKSLRAAIKADNTDQIRQLSVTEGTELGQLMAIRASARANMYKMLTPEQQKKLSTLQAAMHRSRRGPESSAVQN
jgi:Spy/CpxP family protein refolding chaperone